MLAVVQLHRCGWQYCGTSRAYTGPSASIRGNASASSSRLLKAAMPVLGERRVMRDLLLEAQAGEPAPRQMHAQLFHQLPLAGDAVQVAEQENAQ